MADDITTAYATERDQLVAQLRTLTEPQWATPSLCDGWTVRDVTAHILMPYELRIPRFLAGILRARFGFDRLADRWALADTRTGPQLVDAVAATTADGFNVPGAGENAPLSHLFLHAQDMREPLGLAWTASAASAASGRRVLDDLTQGKHAIDSATTHGLRLEAPDIDWTSGSGAVVTGPAAVLASALMGRIASAGQLKGDGAETLRARL